MHYVILIDPGVSGSEPKGTYPPLDIGLEKDIFVKDSRGKKPLYGKVQSIFSSDFKLMLYYIMGHSWTNKTTKI